MTIAKIISGGQTGVDIAALRAAKSRGIPTGGTMPRGFLAHGPRHGVAARHPEYADLYGMREHPHSDRWAPRTFTNVHDADMTLRIAYDFESPGERLTLAACQKMGRPVVDVPVRHMGGGRLVADMEEGIFAAIDRIEAVAARLGHAIVLNVAGNSERTALGIEAFAEGIVKMILDGC